MRSLWFVILVTIVSISCSNSQSQTTKTSLSVTEFASKLEEMPTVALVDVRTPEEFSKGHLKNAVNYNWSGNDFEKQVAKLEKSKPVFIYCLSGSRSSAAARKMRSAGFKHVYEMEGGLMKWRGAHLPEITDPSVAISGMTGQQFDQLLNSDKLILIDFYADWCAPCKKMKPYLDEIARDMSENVSVIGINADDNQALCKELKIDVLPVLQLYKNNKLIWTNTGFIEKAEVVKQLRIENR